MKRFISLFRSNVYVTFLDSNADTVNVRSSAVPNGVLQFTELLATQEVNMKLVAPILDVKDISKKGYPRALKTTFWDAVAGVTAVDTNTMAGVK